MLSFLGLREVGGIFNGILFSHKNNEIRSFAAPWMDLEILILGELNQIEKDLAF